MFHITVSLPFSVLLFLNYCHHVEGLSKQNMFNLNKLDNPSHHLKTNDFDQHAQAIQQTKTPKSLQTMLFSAAKLRKRGFNSIHTMRVAEVTPDSTKSISGVEKMDERARSETKQVKSLTLNVYRDFFFCSPCMCSQTRSAFVVANCSSLRLHGIPKNLTEEVWLIDVSKNRMKQFVFNSTLIYPNLDTLTADYNQIKVLVMGNRSQQVSQLKHFHLDHNFISKLEDNFFSVMPKLIELRLAHNKIHSLNSFTFQGLSNLKTLDLSHNVMYTIYHGSFAPLISLETLLLYGNGFIEYNKFYSPTFQFNTMLRTLYIQGFSEGNGQYPNEALGRLANLSELNIDMLRNEVKLGPQLRNLRRLKVLKFGPYAHCREGNVTSGFFENLPYLTSLEFTSGCLLRHFDPQALSKLRYLRSLTISLQHSFELDTAFQILKGLPNGTQLTSLSFVFLKKVPCMLMMKKQGQYIANLPLEEMDLSGNSITLLHDEFLHRIPKTIKTLTLKHNLLILTGNIWDRVTFLKNLEELDVSGQVTVFDHRHRDDPMPDTTWWLGSGKCALDTISTDCKNVSTSVTGMENDTFMQYTLSNNTSNLHNDFNHHMQTYGETPSASWPLSVTNWQTSLAQDRFGMSSQKNENRNVHELKKEIMHIPPKLRLVRANQYAYFGMVIFVHDLGKNELVSVDFSNSFMTYWGLGWLPDHLEHVDLSTNYCSVLKPRFFSKKNSVKTLILKNNILGPSFAADNLGLIFAHLNRTEFLDISNNLIFSLPVVFFRGLKNLRKLQVSQNKLQVLNVSLSHMSVVEYLDFSDNSITWISKKTRDDLDFIVSQHPVEFDLTHNPLPCTCSGIAVLNWLANTNVKLVNIDILQCRTDRGTIEYIGDIQMRVLSLKQNCASSKYFIYLSALSITVLATLLVVYIFRWRLRYLKNTFMSAWFGFAPNHQDCEDNFKYDAYVVYQEEDRRVALEISKRLEVERGQKLCIGDRDFMPGTSLVSNITNAVINSRSLLVLISENFLFEDDVEYAIRMAIFEELDKNQSFIHVMLCENLLNIDFPNELLKTMSRNQFTQMPLENDVSPEMMQGFWDELSRAVRRSRSHNY